MIARLEGRLAECRPDAVVIDVGGVGYHVHIPLGTYYRVSRGGPTCALFVHTHVREDALQLFGFATAAERATFRRLIGIGGVGPRMALAILSGIGVDEFYLTVLQQDRARLQRIPGVGKKTADRLLLELKDEATRRAEGEPLPGEGPAPDGAAGGDGAEDGDAAGGLALVRDAVSALTNLGYPAETARKAVLRAREALGDAADDLQAVLKRALAHLVR